MTSNEVREPRLEGSRVPAGEVNPTADTPERTSGGFHTAEASDEECRLVSPAWGALLRSRGIDPEQPYDTLPTPEGVLLVQPSQPWKPPECEPVGIIEIAELLGVKRNTVDMWRVRGVFPSPRWTVGGRPCWNQSDVLAWARATRRLH